MDYSFNFGFFVTNHLNQKLSTTMIENTADELMHAVLSRENDLVFDSSVGAVLRKSEIDVDLVVDANNERAAAALAADFVSEAIREIGGTPIGLFVFPPAKPRKTPRQDWHERKAELLTI